MMKKLSFTHAMIERLIRYRRSLLLYDRPQIYSHELAQATGLSAVQVRRDITALGIYGSPATGYDREALLSLLGRVIDPPEPEGVALVGIGDIGRGILHYFQGRSQALRITALFDKDPHKVNRVIHGCRAYPVEAISRVVPEQKIRVGIITVPEHAAQEVADRLVEAGIRGILNYAPVWLRVPSGVFVENRDVIVSVEKLAFLARPTAS